MSAAGIDSRRAWGVVGAAFAAMFTAFGIAYSYGAFLEELRADFGAGRALGAAFFSLTSLLYFGLGSLSGAAADRWGPRRVLLTGAAAFGLGLVATASAGSLAVALVAYGLGVGIGVACAYVPMVALVGGWFERRRTLALGVAVAGVGIGTLTVPPATAALIESAGWRDAYLVQGLAATAVLAVCALLVRPAPPAAVGTGTRVAEAARDRSYRWLYLASVLVSVVVFVPFVHLPAYA
jgi:MFS family permease